MREADTSELSRAAYRGGATAFVHRPVVSSTMDVAHELAVEGASAGLVVVADRQERGRGRAGNRWSSARPDGLWMTVVERPADPSTLDVLALRVGLLAARALDAFARSSVQLKWPNDLYVAGGKLGGILVEARWRGARLDWVAIGLGVNLVIPADFPRAACLQANVTRESLMAPVVDALRTAAVGGAELTAGELADWRSRDIAAGAAITAPVAGIVHGVAPNGHLVVRTAVGETEIRAGSLDFADPAWAMRLTGGSRRG